MERSISFNDSSSKEIKGAYSLLPVIWKKRPLKRVNGGSRNSLNSIMSASGLKNSSKAEVFISHIQKFLISPFLKEDTVLKRSVISFLFNLTVLKQSIFLCSKRKTKSNTLFFSLNINRYKQILRFAFFKLILHNNSS